MKIYHVYPLNDIKEHITEATKDCDCNPEIQYQDNGNIIVVHTSFDGRENFEWDNKVREN